MENKKEKDKDWVLNIIIIVSILLVVLLWLINYCTLKDNYEHRGTFGDMFGAVNAVFSGLAFAGIIISLYMQRRDLGYQREAIEQTNIEFKAQNKTLEIQKFENQYYKMIDLHKENVNELKIDLYNYPKSDIVDTLKGKAVFEIMVEELDEAFSVCSKSESLKKENINPLEHGYKVFFWGLDSKFVKIGKLHSVTNLYMDLDKVNIDKRYKEFQGHELRLAHYYRHLFQTVKYVVQREEQGLITYIEARQYLRVLRAQLSNSEQLLLYYNYISSFGANWDKLGAKGYRFLTKYRMIHNIPIDRVSKDVVSPRKHFSEYIKNNNLIKDSLFEWDDD